MWWAVPQIFTIEDCVQYQGSSCGICTGRSGIRRIFLWAP